MLRLRLVSCSLLLSACADDPTGNRNRQAPLDGEMIPVSSTGGTYCDPLMSVFPVADSHNIGYDNASCGTGTC